MTAALTAFYRRVRVAHVEAGLRTGDRFQPFPEEINRRIVDTLCGWHFVPTAENRLALLREGVSDRTIAVTGNTVIDALMMSVERVRRTVPTSAFDGRGVILVTAHRRENFGEPIEEICSALARIARSYPADVLIVCPVHLNPNVGRPVRSILGGIGNVSLIEPLGTWISSGCWTAPTSS